MYNIKKNKGILSALFVALIACGLIASLKSAIFVKAHAPGISTLVSINNTGNNQGGNEHSPAKLDRDSFNISADGRFVAFSSKSSNLVANDTNGHIDIFVRDLQNNTTTRVNVSTSGAQADDTTHSYAGDLAISETGRYVAFVSMATNLIDGQTISSSSSQIYLRDTKNNTTTLVTQKSDGTVGNAVTSVHGVSNDGRFVLWSGGRNTNLASGGTSAYMNHLYLADLQAREFTLINSGYNVAGTSNSMSCDGSFIVFSTTESIDPNDTDDKSDIYLLDVRNGFTLRSITSIPLSDPLKSAIFPSISCSGRYITFSSSDSIFSTLVSPSNILDHLYVYDRINEDINIVDATSAGIVGNASTGHSTVDDNGNVAFSAGATNLYGNPPVAQVVMKHKETGDISILSLDPNGNYGNFAGMPSLSSDGKKVVYRTGNFGTNILTGLTSDDTNGRQDIIMSLTGL